MDDPLARLPRSSVGQLNIDLQALVDNYRQLATQTGHQPAAMVKADGYGLGLEPVVRRLVTEGCRHFFVARLAEASRAVDVLDDFAKRGDPDRPEVLLLDGVYPGAEELLITLGATPVLSSLDQVERWARSASEQKRRLPAALHVDTGMRRLGLPNNEWTTVVEQPGRLDGLDVRHVLSHLACADTDALAQAEGRPIGFSGEQLRRFREIRSVFPDAIASLANSAGTFCGSEFYFDLTRPGISLYGGSPWGSARANPVRPVVTATVPVLQVQTVTAGQSVGYGATWRAPATTRLATLAVGYADGFHRSLSGRGAVAVAGSGERAPIVGRVSMDLTTVDVGHLDSSLVKPGTEMELFGSQIPIDEVADEAQTISYELLTSLGARYHRRYTG